jgi:hypothetical protein
MIRLTLSAPVALAFALSVASAQTKGPDTKSSSPAGESKRADDKPKAKPLDLTQIVQEEAARRVAHAQAMREGIANGNRAPDRELFEAQQKERSKLAGKAVDGFIVVIKVDRLPTTLKGQYVMSAVEGCPGAVVRCNSEDALDDVFRILKRGDRVYVQGQVGKHIDQLVECSFAIMNVTKASKTKAAPKTLAHKPVSDEDKAQGRLKVGQMLIKDGRISEGRYRLESLLVDLPNTKAATEAKKILNRD